MLNSADVLRQSRAREGSNLRVHSKWYVLLGATVAFILCLYYVAKGGGAQYHATTTPVSNRELCVRKAIKYYDEYLDMQSGDRFGIHYARTLRSRTDPTDVYLIDVWYLFPEGTGSKAMTFYAHGPTESFSKDDIIREQVMGDTKSFTVRNYRLTVNDETKTADWTPLR